MQRRPRKMQTRPDTIDFAIDHIDPLGQGVSKQGGTVTFIAGTLPGESGLATVYRRAKGVQFARLQTLEKTADNRVEPGCPHFELCPGCQFLHTDYASELNYKKAVLQRYLGALGVDMDGIEVVPAPRRLAYRNRVQLHYRHKYIGMLDPVSDQVLEVPHCKIMREELRPAFARLYQGDWQKDHPGRGHCELYYKAGEVSVRWNGSYAHGGFSQVYEEMNLVLQERVQTLLAALGSKCLLDIFAGSGNLSDAFAAAGGRRVMLDSHADPGCAGLDNFYQMDLYAEEALPDFIRRAGVADFDTVLVDPPRRGFPGLAGWVKKINPRYLLYVSCNPASLARDLRGLGARCRIETVQLLDLFPATAHFETLIALQIK